MTRSSLPLVLLGALLALAAAEPTQYFREEFGDGDAWTQRWVESKHKPDYGRFVLSAGKFYGDAEKDKGIQTSQDARFYALSARFEPFSNRGRSLVLQFSVKHEQGIDCGGGYVKLFPASLDQADMHGDSEYNIMFGPDICGPGTKKVHVILNYKGKNVLINKDIRCKDDEFTHLYTLVLRPDNTYEVKIDNGRVEGGALEEDWELLPPRRIRDPQAHKPEDWDERAKIDDPEDTKPEDWDKPEHIPDPDAKKPEDWDEEMDGEWEPPVIPNPEYKGEWRPRQIDNPDYKGKWVHPEIDNPEYSPDPLLYAYDSFGVIGLDLWQVKSGTIFDNFLITDDEKLAEEIGNETWGATKDAERRMKEQQDEEQRQRQEEEEKQHKDDDGGDNDDEEEEDEDEEDEDEDDEDEDERGGGGGGGGSARARFARGDYFRCCKVCYPLCAFVILAACVVACVGLVWMQVALKEDLDALKDQFRSLESNQKSSFQEIPKLNEELLRKQKQLEKIESGDLGLSKVWINITEMTKQIASLTSTVNHLKANIKSASDLISLPATVEGLQKSVASIGSTLNSVRLAVEAVQKTVDEHKKTIETLQSDLIQHLVKESKTVTPSPSAAPDLGRKNLRESLQQKEESSISKLREKLQLITALTSKPEASKEEKKQSAASEPATFPRISPRSLGNQEEAAKHLKPVIIPEISSLADLLDLFQRTGQGPEGKLSYHDLWNLLGSALPSAQSMAEFDVDRDGTYSFPELRLALGIEHMEQN